MQRGELTRPKCAQDPDPVLLYDGECGLCNACVRLLMRLDKGARLRYSPLQSSAAQTYLSAHGLPTEDLDSMIFVPDWSAGAASRPLFRTSAGLRALSNIGGIWRVLAAVFHVVPRPLRDAAYKIVARFRYQIFGPYKPRPYPNPQWERRILR